MVANPQRRAAVADAALSLLGREGGRALTHRAADREAQVPVGTAANYFPTRSALLLAMAERIFELLQPDSDRLKNLAIVDDNQALESYVLYVVERLLDNPNLARALIEIRLEASRSPEVFDVVAPFLRQGLAADVEFHRSRGLVGGRPTVLLLHHLVNGIVLDQLTVPLDPNRSAEAVARDAVERLTRDS